MDRLTAAFTLVMALAMMGSCGGTSENGQRWGGGGTSAGDTSKGGGSSGGGSSSAGSSGAGSTWSGAGNPNGGGSPAGTGGDGGSGARCGGPVLPCASASTTCERPGETCSYSSSEICPPYGSGSADAYYDGCECIRYGNTLRWRCCPFGNDPNTGCSAGDPNVDVCGLPSDGGQCLAAYLRYWHNPATGECEAFTYGGCQGNANNFETVEACESLCADYAGGGQGGEGGGS